MVLAIGGLAMKFFAITGGSYVFVFATAFLALLFLVQIGLSFVYAVSNIRLALLGAVSSVALVLGMLALIFRYQHWVGWQVMCFTALPLFLLAALFMAAYLRRRHLLPAAHRAFLYRNLALPFGFLLALAVLALITDTRRLQDISDVRLKDSPVDHDTTRDTSGTWKAY